MLKSKKFNRLASIFLSVILLINMIPASTYASDGVGAAPVAAPTEQANEGEAAGTPLLTEASESVTLPPVSSAEGNDAEEPDVAATDEPDADADSESDAAPEEDPADDPDEDLDAAPDADAADDPEAGPEEDADADSDEGLMEVPDEETEPAEPVEFVVYQFGNLLAYAIGDKNTPPQQDPVVGDNVVIEKATVRWLTASDNDDSGQAGFGDLYLAPEGDEVKTQQFQIDFALSGQSAFAPGTVQIEIPAYLWENSANQEYGDLTLSIPKEPDTSAEFAWRREGDKIIITNTKPIAAASKVMIQGSIRNMKGHEMVDGADSRELQATVTVTTPLGNKLHMDSNEIKAHLETYVDITGASKTAYDPLNKDYDVWWEAIPDTIPKELLPEDEQQPPENTKYVYVRWYVQGSARGNQPYRMWIEDTVEEKYDGIMLGVSDSWNGTVKSTDGKSVEATLFEGYDVMAKTAYVWTAYPKSAFENLSADEKKNITFYNKQTTHVEGIYGDTPDPMDADDHVHTKVPEKYKFIKIWDDNDNAAGKRPGRLGLEIYDDSVSTTVPRMTRILTEKDAEKGNNHWAYEWSDEGKTDCEFRVVEILYDSEGVFDDRFDNQGRNRRWQYRLVNTYYDTATNTWKYTNAFSEFWGDPSVITKRVSQDFTDKTVDSTRDTHLNTLKSGEDSVLVPFNVSTTLASTAASVWGKSLAAVPNTFTLEDGEYLLDLKELTVKDIDVGTVTIWTPQAWKYLLNTFDPETGYYAREKVDPASAVLSGLMNGEWKPMATLENGILTAAAGSGATVEDRKVSLPVGVEKIRLEMECDAQIVELSYQISLRVHPTETVQQMIADAFERADYICFSLYNRARSYVTYTGKEPVDVGGKTWEPGEKLFNDLLANDMGYLHGRLYKVATDLAKTFKEVMNDTSNQRILMHTTLTLTQQSNVLSLDEYLKAIERNDIPNTTSGIYYDLLPPGVDPIIGSITLSDGDTVTNKWTVENYKGSGRTLLVVMVDETNNFSYSAKTSNPADSLLYPQEGYKNQHRLEFDCYCSWQVAQSIDLSDLRNVASYEAAEDWIGSWKDWSGEADDPADRNHMLSQGAVGNDLALMTGLHGGRNTPSFVYAGEKLSFTPEDFSAKAELRKDVSVAGSGVWSKGEKNDVNVQEGGDYTYRLYMKAGTDTVTSDIILLDSIENYVPHDVDEDVGDEQWRGGLLGVDVSQMRRIGVDAIVYYSTVSNLDISREAYNPNQEAGVVQQRLKDTSVWSTQPPEDMSTVTAIAIDATMGLDGKPFSLDGNSKDKSSLVAYLYMRAPYDQTTDSPAYFRGTDGRDHMQNAHAYNNVYLDSVSVTANSSTHAYIHYSYTKVGIYTKYFDVTKVWDDSDDVDGKRPTEIQVRLLADGKRMEPDQVITLNDENDWHDEFDRVLTYNDDGTRIMYSYEEIFVGNDFRDDYKLTVTRQDGADKVSITLKNTHEPEKITIPVTKEWEGEEDVDANVTRPESIVVKLYANDVYTGRSLTIRPDAEGKWYGEFTDLNKYYDHGKEIEYRVEEEYVDDYITTYGEDEDGNPVITNTYYPFGDLKVQKLLMDATKAAAERGVFTFGLELVTEDGKDVITKYAYIIYDENGEPATDEDGNELSGMIGNGGTFTLKGGQYIYIKDIPTHIRYTVQETAQEPFTRWQVTAEGDTGVIRSGTEALFAEITNRYESTGSVQLQARKELLSDHGDTPWPFNAYDFSAQLVDQDGNVVTAFVSEDGVFTFGELTYTVEDDNKKFTYDIVEVNGGKGGYTYDKTLFTAEVTPVDNGDGTMTCHVVYKDGEGNVIFNGVPGVDAVTLPEFRNQYHAEGSIALRAWKTLKVKSLADYTFDFSLYEYVPGTGINPLQTAHNDADGNVVFEALEFNETNAGETHFYLVREVKEGYQPDEYDKVIFDDSTFCYVVEIVDNGDGTLSFNQKTHDLTCADCEGSGEVEDASSDPENPVMVECAKCKGVGYLLPVICDDCQGSGMIEVVDEDNPDQLKTVTCTECAGGGYLLPNAEGVPAVPADVTPVFNNDMKPGALSVMKFAETDPNNLDVFHFVIEFYGPDADKITELTEKPEPADVDKVPDEDYWAKWEDYPENQPANGQPDTPTDEPVDEVPEAAAISGARLTASLISIGDYAVPLAAGNIIANGTTDARTSGSSTQKTQLVDWEIYSDGTLVLKPQAGNANGYLPSYSLTKLPPWHAYQEYITQIEIQGNIAIHANSAALFHGLSKLVKADLKDLPLGSAEDLSDMFSGCSALQEVIFASGMAQNVEDISYMFYGCSSLGSVDFGGIFQGTGDHGFGIDYQNIKAENVFSGCSSLTSVDFGSASNARLTDVTNMFGNGIDALERINFGSMTLDSSIGGSSNLDKCINLAYVTFGPDFYADAKNSSAFDLPGGSDEYWVLQSKKDTAEEQTYTLLASDIRAKWTSAYAGTWEHQVKNYTITFEAGAEDATGTMEPVKVNAADPTDPLNSSFSRPGYEQVRWELWLNDVKKDDIPLGYVIPANTYKPRDEVKLIAVWEELTYTVTFEGGEGSLGGRGQETYALSENFEIPPYAFVIFGLKQVGWKVSGDTSGTIYQPGEMYTGPRTTDGIVLVPVWDDDIRTGTVTNGHYEFDVHNGEKVTLSDIPAGTTYKLYEVTPKGWILVEQSGETGVIEPLKTAEASFYNIYRMNLTSIRLSGMKNKDGVAAGGFEFELLEVQPDGSRVRIGETVKSLADGTFSFPEIVYDKDDEHHYIIREVVPDPQDATIDYDTHEVEVTVTVTDDGEGLLSCAATYEGSTVFNNTTNPGSLEITKTASGQADAAFAFRIRMLNSNGTPVEDKEYEFTVGGAARKATSDKGYITVRDVKAGDSIFFDGLPAGTKYEIEEIELPAGWSQSTNGTTGLNGTIESAQTAKETVHNTYSAFGSIVLSARKTLKDAPLQAGMFEFVLEQKMANGDYVEKSRVKNGTPDPVESTTDDDGSVTPNPNYGIGAVIFDAVDFTETGTYIFRIREVEPTNPADHVDKVVYDTDYIEVTVDVSDNGDGTLSAVATYVKCNANNGMPVTDDNGNPVDGTLFVNEMEPGSLTVFKTLKYPDKSPKDAEFTFHVVIKESDAEGANVLTGPFKGRKSNDEEFEITDVDNTVTIKGGESFTIEDLPLGAYYEVTEDQNVPGFELLEGECTGTTGIIGTEERDEAEFVNLYTATGSYVFEALKKVNNGTAEGGAIPAGLFEFVLMDASNNVLSTSYADANGKIVFTPVDFTLEDNGKEFVFRIVERQGTNDDYYYDPHTETIVLKVKDDGQGHMVVDSIQYDDDGAVFTNLISGLLYDMEISKTVTGSMGNLAEDFTFTLTLANDTIALPTQIEFERGDLNGFFTLDVQKSWTFTLAHGESIRILNLPVGTVFTVEEKLSDEQAGYRTQIIAGPNGTVTERKVEGTLTEAERIAYTNSREGVVPTGTALPTEWLIPMLALALAGALWLLLKRSRSV